MTSNIRTKAPKRKDRVQKVQPENHVQKDLKRGIRISVEDLRVGDRIVLSWHGQRLDKMTKEEVIEAMLDFTRGESRFVAKSKRVDNITECPSCWRTHVHINKQDCYDMRGTVWVVDND